jgi:hypothetical protein
MATKRQKIAMGTCLVFAIVWAVTSWCFNDPDARTNTAVFVAALFIIYAQTD